MTISTVLPGGTILLGQKVACDGFSFMRPVRVITHAHGDHIQGFESSLGFQDPILMLSATKDLIYAIKGAKSLKFRRNLVAVNANEPYRFSQEIITLLPANHMLGSAQVLVETEHGHRLGYTGDFRWPIPVLEGLDELVIDATYGNPDYIRDYNEEDVIADFLDLVYRLLAEGKRVCIKAVTGRLQFAMQLLQPHLQIPFLASKKQTAIADVYQAYGLLSRPCIDRSCAAGQKILKDRIPNISFNHYAEHIPESEFDVFVIISAYMVPREEPIRQTGPRTYWVALTDHADFVGTLLYVSQAKPKLVIADRSRGGDAETLVKEIRRRLDMPAIAAG